MAVDSRDKRMSMVGFGNPRPGVLPNPDGTVGTADRAMLLGLYSGIALGAVAAIAGIVLTGRARVLALVGAARSFVLTGQDRGL